MQTTMFRQIIEDFRKGENIEIYLTIMLSLPAVVANIVLSLIGVETERVIAPLTLMVLSGLAVVLLGNRWRLDNLEKRSSTSVMQQRFPETHLEDFTNASSILQTGIHLFTNLNEHFSEYNAVLNKGARLQILLADPDGHVFEMVAIRFAGKIDPNDERSRAQASIAKLKNLMRTFPNQIEVRVIDYLFEYSAMLINPDSSDSIIYLERYTIQKFGGGMKPKFVFTPNDRQWYDLCKHEMRALWSEARPLP